MVPDALHFWGTFNQVAYITSGGSNDFQLHSLAQVADRYAVTYFY